MAEGSQTQGGQVNNYFVTLKLLFILQNVIPILKDVKTR